MNIKIFIASTIVAIILSTIAFFIDLYTIFPAVLAIFVTALVFWVCSAEGINTENTEKVPPRKKGKPINKGTKETGSVKWFSANKGFGFITRDNGEDIFVHFRSIMGKGHKILREGQKVEFAVTEGTKGLQAEDVSPVKG
jgi:CspA family cold shock protein